MGDPLNLRMSGVTISQPDLPHWCVYILNWLGMVGAMQQAGGSLGNTYRDQVKRALETGEMFGYTNLKTGKTTYSSGPAAIYGVYQSFSMALEREANKQ